MASADTTKEKYTIVNFFCDLLDIIEAMIVAVFVIFMLFMFIMLPVTVDGPSMQPTLYDKDRLLMWTIGYEPQVNDIVVVNNKKGGFFTDDTETQVELRDALQMRIIKRVIATAGQTVDIDFDKHTVARDGVVLDEPYIAEPTGIDEGGFDYPITIPEGYVFVMGDNRNNSTDSRSISVGLIPEDQVLGKVFLRFYRVSDLCDKLTDRFAWLLGK